MSCRALAWNYDLGKQHAHDDAWISAVEMAVFRALCWHHNHIDGLCCPGIPALMAETRLGHSTVKKALKSLRDTWKLIDETVAAYKGHLVRAWVLPIPDTYKEPVLANEMPDEPEEAEPALAETADTAKALLEPITRNNPNKTSGPPYGGSRERGARARARRVPEGDPALAPIPTTLDPKWLEHSRANRISDPDAHLEFASFVVWYRLRKITADTPENWFLRWGQWLLRLIRRRRDMVVGFEVPMSQPAGAEEEDLDDEEEDAEPEEEPPPQAPPPSFRDRVRFARQNARENDARCGAMHHYAGALEQYLQRQARAGRMTDPEDAKWFQSVKDFLGPFPDDYVYFRDDG